MRALKNSHANLNVLSTTHVALQEYAKRYACSLRHMATVLLDKSVDEDLYRKTIEENFRKN